MNLPKLSLLGLCIATLAALAPASATAQQPNKPAIDFAPLVPPVFPLPPTTTVTPGGVGGAQQSPYTTAPLQDPAPSVRDRQPAPGLKLTIPTR